MSDQLQLSEEMSAGAARLRVDVYGGEPREHVLDDLTFLNYRLADVRISPDGDAGGAGHRLAPGRREGDRLRRSRRMTFTGPWPAGPIQKVIVTMLALRMEAVGLHPFHASAVRYRGKTRPLPRRRVEPRQVDGPDRGLPPRRAARSHRDDGHRRGRPRRRWARSRHVPQEADRGHRAADKAAPKRGVEKFFGEMPTWGMYDGPSQRRRRRRPRDRRQLRPGHERRDDPVRAPVPDAPLAPELLPAPTSCWPRATPCRSSTPTTLRAARADFVRAVLPSVPSSSSARPPPRCSWTRSTEGPVTEAPDDARRSPTRDRPARRGRRPARRARPRRPRPGRRHRPDHPPPRRDRPAVASSSTSSGSPSSTARSATPTAPDDRRRRR